MAGGGTLVGSSVATVTGSTISGNSAINDGGGIWASGFGFELVTHTIIAGNTRGVADTPNDVTSSVSVAFSLLGVLM